MKFQDDRTEEQRLTHRVIVLATDSFMSGWGEAAGGASYAGWACRPKHVDRVERWVKARGDMRRVRVVSGDYRPPARAGHCHVYVVDEGHRALQPLNP